MSDDPRQPGKWEKGGPSPNPKGRPKKGATIKELLRRKIGEDRIVDLIAARLEDENPERADKFLMRLWDGLDGKPAQEVINSGNVSGRVVVVPANDRDRRIMDRDDEEGEADPDDPTLQ